MNIDYHVELERHVYSVPYQLSAGFREALEILGQGFLAHPANTRLRTALHAGDLTKGGFFEQLLRLVYRLVFLLTVEERDLLHPENASESARRLYADGYGFRRLRDRAVRRGAHDRQGDLWEAVAIVFRGLAGGEPRLGLPALAGLFASGECPDLDAAKLENRALLGALFRLAWLREPSGLVRVNWRDMGADELGYVYEGLLELVPQITGDGRSFSFARAGESRGHARKTTGSYYTPDELVQVLLDSALDPVVERTVDAHPERPVDALLELAIVDPACGSGHFLLAAATGPSRRTTQIRTYPGLPNSTTKSWSASRAGARCTSAATCTWTGRPAEPSSWPSTTTARMTEDRGGPSSISITRLSWRLAVPRWTANRRSRGRTSSRGRRRVRSGPRAPAVSSAAVSFQRS